MKRFDAIVVGGGAMGSTAAWQLSKRGRSVLLLEQFERGHVRGGSHGASRIFRLAYPDEDYVRMAQRALRLWRELEDETEVPLLDQTGGVDHGAPDILEPIAKALRESNASCEYLEPLEATRRWPGMRFDSRVLFQPDAGRVNADAVVAALQTATSKRGGDVRFSVPVTSITEDGDRACVATGGEVFEAPVAVVAVGSWAPKLLPAISLPPLRVSKEQPAHFRPLDGTAWPSFIHYSPGVRGTSGGFGVYGLETPGEGVKVGEHMVGPVVDPDDRTFDAEEALLESVSRYVAEWLPGLDPTPVSYTTCLYDSTPNADFVLDRVGRLVVATGFSGHGFKFVPEIGRILADLADGDDASTPDRFRLRHHAVS